jgi:hypothetical protein
MIRERSHSSSSMKRRISEPVWLSALARRLRDVQLACHAALGQAHRLQVAHGELEPLIAQLHQPLDAGFARAHERTSGMRGKLESRACMRAFD